MHKKDNKFLQESIEKGIITNPYREDGMGEHIKNILNAIVYAKIFKLKYVYTPLKKVEHNYKNEDDFIKRIEDIIGVREYYEIADTEGVHKGLQRDLKIDDSGRLNDFFITNINNLHMSKEYIEVMTKIKNRHKYEDYFNNKYFNITIHIRRSNPNDTKNYDKNHVNGYLNYQINSYPDEFYVKLINILYKKYTKEQSKPIKIHIHSQDLDKDFYDSNLNDDIKKCTEYHLYEEHTKAFISMILSDILVSSPSNFSYVAALIKITGVIYLKFFYPPMKTWNNLIIS